MADVFTLDKSDLEETCDQAKAATLVSLVNEGHLSLEEAEEWASTHTIMIKKKGFFRTITDRWKKANDQGYLIFIVSNPYLKFNLPPVGDGEGLAGNKLVDILDKVKRDNPDLDDKEDKEKE